jgi:methylenetetrahydrofolate reductase (NADPH)
VAARMVRDRGHLDELLDAMGQAEADLFLIGGDATPPLGPWSSAVELLPVISEHPQRPSEIGIAGYPEGHPLIDSATLADVLKRKSTLAGYITTQLCFDPEALLAWLRETREGGVTLPVLVGLPGVVDRRRLLEMSMRIGVGPSLSFLRKQRGLRKLLGPSRVTPDRVYDGLAPFLGDRELNVIGFHYYTFNQLVETWKWEGENRGHFPLVAES